MRVGCWKREGWFVVVEDSMTERVQFMNVVLNEKMKHIHKDLIAMILNLLSKSRFLGQSSIFESTVSRISVPKISHPDSSRTNNLSERTRLHK